LKGLSKSPVKGEKTIKFILRSDESTGKLKSVTKKKGFLLAKTAFKVNFNYTEAGKCYPATGKKGKKTFNTDLCVDLATYYKDRPEVYSCMEKLFITSRSDDGLSVNAKRNPMSELFDILQKHNPMFSTMSSAEAEAAYQLPVISMREIFNCKDFGLVEFDETTGYVPAAGKFVNEQADKGAVKYHTGRGKKRVESEGKAFGI
jgi:hypothetical protein